MSRPSLVTARLRLDPFAGVDVDEVHALLAEPAVRRYLCDDVVMPREQVAGFVDVSDRLFEEYRAGLWCVRLSDGRRIVGLAGFFWLHDQLELLYALLPELWGKGLATESAREVVRFGFDLCGLEVVIASTDAPNVASVGVMERLGMRFDRREVVDGLDTLFYTLSRAAFVAKERA